MARPRHVHKRVTPEEGEETVVLANRFGLRYQIEPAN